MTSRRVQKAAQAIREVVSTAILMELNDPRIENVTVTYVEVSGDMRHAKVHVSVMGDEQQQSLCMHGLQHAAGFLQSKVAKRVETRYTPQLKFVLDMGVKRSIEINRILESVLPRERNDAAVSDVAGASGEAGASGDADASGDAGASEEADASGDADEDER